MDWFWYFYDFILYFLIYPSLLFYRPEDGDIAGGKIWEDTVYKN